MLDVVFTIYPSAHKDVIVVGTQLTTFWNKKNPKTYKYVETVIFLYSFLLYYTYLLKWEMKNNVILYNPTEKKVAGDGKSYL